MESTKYTLLFSLGAKAPQKFTNKIELCVNERPHSSLLQTSWVSMRQAALLILKLKIPKIKLPKHLFTMTKTGSTAVHQNGGRTSTGYVLIVKV